MNQYRNQKIKIKEKIIISNHSLPSLLTHTLTILTVMLRNMRTIKILEVFQGWGKLVRLIRIDIIVLFIIYKVNIGMHEII
mgnify:CR=1 FL=1